MDLNRIEWNTKSFTYVTYEFLHDDGDVVVAVVVVVVSVHTQATDVTSLRSRDICHSNEFNFFFFFVGLGRRVKHTHSFATLIRYANQTKSPFSTKIVEKSISTKEM